MRTKPGNHLLSAAVILAMVFGFAPNGSAVQMGGAIQGTPINVEPAVVSTFAGLAGSSGATDATGTVARFYYPQGITTDGTNLFVATAAHTIRKIVISTGVVTTIAGSAGIAGSTDGTGTSARFNFPYDITTDGTNLFVADTYNHTIRQIVISTSAVTTIAGSVGITGSTDATGTSARFSYPGSITTDGTNLFVTDNNNSTIRKIVISTGDVTTIAGSAGVTGSTDGTGTSARFYNSIGITTDGTNLFVADFSNHTIRKIVISTGVVTTIAGSALSSGSTDAAGTSARFYNPDGITTDGTNLFVSDSNNHTIRKIVISTGVVTTIAGTAGSLGSTDGTGTSARFNGPYGITTDGTNLFVDDYNNHTVRRIEGATNTMASPVYRFVSDHDHFFTISEDEKNYVMQNLTNYHYEGQAFYAYPTQLSGTYPVYRFVSDHDHFFTISEDEKNYVMQNLTNYHYEGQAFYAYPTQLSGTYPVYRFVSDHDHFFTISEDEKNYVMQNLTNYHYEGQAFYAYPPPSPPPDCIYVYSDWSACQPDNTQTRTILSSSPEGCVGTPILSQPCNVPPTCTYSISPTSKSFGSSGGSGSVTVTTSSSNCPWMASESLDWVSITSGSSGTGSGTVTFTVSANTSTSSRTGNITIAGQIFTVTQSGITGPSARALQVFKNSKTANGQNTGGDGTITSAPVGIICGATCGAYFSAGEQIVLTAVPDTGSTFTGWSGACAGTGSCTVTMDGDQSVTANFTKPVSGEGGPSIGGNVGVVAKVQGVSGSGTVTSNPAGINCEHSLGYSGDHCFAQFALGLPVILTANPKPGYVFSGWNPIYFYGTPLVKPDCPGTAPCTVLAYGVGYGSTVEARFSRSTAPTPTPPPYCNVGCSSDCFAPVSYQNNSCAECAAVYNWCVANSCGNRKNILYWNACQ